jgi:small subunit ribosomal protein S1
MSPDPKNDLDREIEAALDGINLQAEDMTSSSSGSDKLWKGVVEGISGDDVIIELGPRKQGVVSLLEFEQPPKVGDVLRFAVRGREDDLWLLSLTEAREMAAWDDLTVGSLVKARVSGQNQGGLTLKIGKNEAFMPLSQVSIQRDFEASTLMGQTIVCEVVEVDRGRKRCVLSRRRVEEGERLAAMQESVGRLHPGMVVSGKVTRIEGFGAFIDVGGGLEGLCHVSNISRQRVEDVNDVLKVGQEVKVQVLEIKDGGKRLGLGMKQLEPDPWDRVEQRYHTDSQVAGKVTRIMDFGAFVELESGLEGLLHVSQLGRERVRKVSDVVKLGEEITVRIVAIEPGARRISLSRLDSRGAVLGTDEAVDGNLINDVLAKPEEGGLSTSLGALFKKALENKDPK